MALQKGKLAIRRIDGTRIDCCFVTISFPCGVETSVSSNKTSLVAPGEGTFNNFHVFGGDSAFKEEGNSGTQMSSAQNNFYVTVMYCGLQMIGWALMVQS